MNHSARTLLLSAGLALGGAGLAGPGLAAQPPAGSPYPPSTVVESITWQWDTHLTAALGSDLWPVTWTADGDLFAAWGDGGGFGGGDQDGRVAMGFARISGEPGHLVTTNVNGGKNPLYPASFPTHGKTGGILAVGHVIYAWMNMQDGAWPDVDHRLIWSEDSGKTWQTSPWAFPKGKGHLHPGSFLNFGPGYTAVPPSLSGFVYFYGSRQADDADTFMGRVPTERIRDRSAYEFLSSLSPDGTPAWSPDASLAAPIFSDPRGGGGAASYNPVLKRYFLTVYHDGPGQLGVFDGPQPWGPWTTVFYADDWGQMGSEGEGLTCDFPPKWLSPNGLTAWCVFSVYGAGAKQGIHGHDRFNVVRTVLRLR